MPKIVIHGDFHPGNMKFQEEEVIGLFDPDWSRTETRCFDFALAAVYFCASWEEDRDGDFSLERLQVFLQAYQEKNKSDSTVGPLDTDELRMLPHMIQASNMYLIDWPLTEFYEKDADPDQYLGYLRHQIRLSKWLEENRNALENAIQGFIKHCQSVR